jgi:hypothetical protein
LRPVTRRRLVLALLLAARAASANQCPLLSPHVVTPEIPLGCPLVVYQDPQYNVAIPDVFVDG